MGVFLIAVKEKSGGLALFWANGCSISFKHYSSNIIDVLITNPMGDWRCTFMYGEPKVELRHKLWDQLRFVHAQWSGPWVCAGDFNEALSRDEHLSKGTRGEQQQQQHSLFSQASWGRLEMKPERYKFKVQAH